MSSQIVARQPKQINTFVPAVQPRVAGVNVQKVISGFNLGQRRYLNGEPMSACATADERRGYKAVLDAIADAETDAMFANVPDWQTVPSDNDWIRRGC